MSSEDELCFRFEFSHRLDHIFLYGLIVEIAPQGGR